MFFEIFYKFLNRNRYYYIRRVFRLKNGVQHDDFRLFGNVNILNQNIELGRNAHIYPNVTFGGDGCIRIGDNCSIGQGTVIFASKWRGNYWE